MDLLKYRRFLRQATEHSGIYAKSTVLVLSAFLSTPVPATKVGGNPIADVEQVVRAKVAAYAANDAKKYFGFFAEDISIMFSGGRWRKTDYVTVWNKLLEEGSMKVAATGIEDLRIQILPGGAAAVVTFLFHVTYVAPNGNPMPIKKPNVVFRESEVWVKTNHAWTLIHMSWISDEGV